MRLLSLEVYKKRLVEKKNKASIDSKHIENRLVIELKDKLSYFLKDSDKIMLEVNENVVGEFLNILSDKLLTMYEYEQVDKNKFVFYNKEISF